MVLTVRKVLKIGPLKKARIVAGHQGLDNEITFVNIMEVPEVARWMKGGEFLVTAGLPLKNDPLLRKRIIEELHGKGVSAFGIKPGQFFDTIPDDLIVHADKVGLPLIELPSDIPYMDFMLPIFE
ncbi:MAG TPA: PucR family transcriptional regulator, partial [Clostridia bacterium]|nr:PucR family transcriptional regulator [Clostridia bacterium]